VVDDVTSDYLELPIGPEDLGDDETYDLWVEGLVKPIVLKDVKGATRYRGWWVIDHEWMNTRATAYINAEQVMYFRVLIRKTED
jgi:hypothetical protein